jgi:hypothetical protein
MQDSAANEVGDYFARRTTAVGMNLSDGPSSLSSSDGVGMPLVNFPTSCMTIEQLVWVQRLVLGDSVVRLGIRDVDVWVGGDTPETAVFKPVPHTQVMSKFNILITNWRQGYASLLSEEAETVIGLLAKFHFDILKIHPFLDGNGRVARAILEQQIRELLGTDVHAIFSNTAKEYYEALSRANDGDLALLKALIKAHVDGQPQFATKA